MSGFGATWQPRPVNIGARCSENESVKSYTPSVRAFARSIEDEIRASQRQGAKFAIVILSAAAGITPAERRKLFDWGMLVACNHAPRGAAVCRWEADFSCLMLLPRASAEQGGRAGSDFVEQLNKLPVMGVAPGMGWRSEAVGYPEDTARLRELLALLKSDPARILVPS